jgi:uncharacterized protein YndB with AHSA1/START domain
MDTHAERDFDAQHDLLIARLLPAPPAAVFAAWTEAEQVRQWFGPAGTTVPNCRIEARPGGAFHAVMRDAAGKDHPCNMVIEAIEPSRRLAWRLTEHDPMPALAGATAELSFLEHPLGTRFVAHWRHRTAEARAAHAAMGFADGWGQMLDKLGAHLMRPAAATPFAAPPAPEHGWLTRLLGEWRYETEAAGSPGQPPMHATGVERVSPLGGYWVIGEGEGTCPMGLFVRTIITIGFDPASRRFRGSFVGSMMPQMFVYDGALDARARLLTLDTEGPAMTGEGRARYRDAVEMRSDDHRIVTSEVEQPDGSWHRFMTAQYRRIG